MKLITVCNKIHTRGKNTIYLRFENGYFELVQDKTIPLSMHEFVKATANPRPKYAVGDACLIDH